MDTHEKTLIFYQKNMRAKTRKKLFYGKIRHVSNSVGLQGKRSMKRVIQYIHTYVMYVGTYCNKTGKSLTRCEFRQFSGFTL